MLQEITNALADPHARHAIMVHWPIVLMPVALALLVWFAATRRKMKTVGIAAVVALLGAMAGAGLAAGAGEEAYERVEDLSPPLNTAEKQALERHESLGEGAWIWPLGCAAIAACTLLPRPTKAGHALLALAIIATLAVTARFAWTAHTGGELVYTHGLGVPSRAAPEAVIYQQPRRIHDEDDD